MALLKYHISLLTDLAKGTHEIAWLVAGLLTVGLKTFCIFAFQDSQERIGLLNVDALHAMPAASDFPLMATWSLCLFFVILVRAVVKQRRDTVLLCRLRSESRSIRTRGRRI